MRKLASMAVTALLMLTFAISLVAFPATNAQVPLRTKKTYAFCTATPNPVGVGQETLIWLGISDYLNIYTDGWVGLTVTVTKPNGDVETLGPFRTDSTGSTGTTYTPSMVGTYYLQTHFPAQWFNWTGQANVWYEASDSEKCALNVTEQPREYYPGVPLPTEYWTRPINAQAREWASITGDWLWGAALNNYPYYNWRVSNNALAPESGHILWAKSVTHGGLAGGNIGVEGYFPGDAYEGYFLDAVIIGGVLYYNRFQADGGTRVDQEVVAINLKTGEELWTRNWNNTRISFGQVLKYNSFNTQGAYPYLWQVTGSTWKAFDAATGRFEYAMVNVPSGTTPIYGPNNELLIYTVNSASGWMSMWNSTLVVTSQLSGQEVGSWIRSRKGQTLDATKGIQWNKTIPLGLPGQILSALEDRIIGGTDDAWNTHLAIIRGDYSQTFWCLSTKPGQEGQLLFNVTWNPPPGQMGSAFVGASSEDGIFIVALKSTRQLVALSLDNGQQLWGPTESQTPVDLFTIANYRRGAKSIGDGRVISGGMGGRIHCYDAKTGKLLWTYDAKQKYTEMQWSENWPLYLSFVADGKIYLHVAEHSVNQPMPRGAPFICLNETTGEEIWSLNVRGTHWGGYPIIGDSTIAMFCTYDNRIYAIGRGPSSIKIAVSPKVSVYGNSVLIEGTVTDTSPGTADYALAVRFPEGVPVVSDESMDEWMQYVYMQFPRPANATGVQITLSVLDSNGNYRDIGSTISDADGFFSFQWTPDIPGKYKVIASFAGSESYYPSHAVSAFAVDAAPEATPGPTPTPALMSEMYFLPMSVGLIIAMAVVIALLALLLRKRP
ncbi:PQQ-binding-like beta-propeller repeat protein [Candidatus Bathyarchaeota archaeon A05DMB-2]|jgi:outer membrane protein assembly factor BamB|nr:PQQ-binding-like beta-propeller repeat protein [Candidatus Bathyarchaeota archaeon A05DMB-2]